MRTEPVSPTKCIFLPFSSFHSICLLLFRSFPSSFLWCLQSFAGIFLLTSDIGKSIICIQEKATKKDKERNVTITTSLLPRMYMDQTPCNLTRRVPWVKQLGAFFKDETPLGLHCLHKQICRSKKKEKRQTVTAIINWLLPRHVELFKTTC